ncbi:Leucine-rich repeat and calponin -like proteiny domain-containing protein 1 [Takifugu flavidus]|uniref:Leucine-rich repeat and calponin-like proteiny domain-containing protein 1 n=1 Tax=Takifugu flavidus TaxID=433684 RepID=A0A5C6PBB4_9TELE|nr:Leucine-rich repeat and calponin -like proteiny domain-containing protein 1 [Takifugu flavidus]
MAASVLLGSAENTGLHFAVGGGSSGARTGNVLVGSNNGLGSACPAPWNRSLDRALDEATATGCLNLSGRKLKEFPRSAANHDLTDTTRAGKFPGREPGPAKPAGVPLFWPNCLRAICNRFRRGGVIKFALCLGRVGSKRRQDGNWCPPENGSLSRFRHLAPQKFSPGPQIVLLNGITLNDVF